MITATPSSTRSTTARILHRVDRHSCAVRCHGDRPVAVGPVDGGTGIFEALDDLGMRMAEGIDGADGDEGHRRPDGVEEGGGGAGPAAVMADFEDEALHVVTKVQELRFSRALGVTG